MQLARHENFSRLKYLQSLQQRANFSPALTFPRRLINSTCWRVVTSDFPSSNKKAYENLFITLPVENRILMVEGEVDAMRLESGSDQDQKHGWASRAGFNPLKAGKLFRKLIISPLFFVTAHLDPSSTYNRTLLILALPRLINFPPREFSISYCALFSLAPSQTSNLYRNSGRAFDIERRANQIQWDFFLTTTEDE